MADDGNFVPSPFRAGYEAFQDGGYVGSLPFYQAPFESRESSPELAAKYPLNMVSTKSHGFLNSQYANEVKRQRRQGGPVEILHTDDAEHRGIADGDPVRVYNDRGAFTGAALVTADTMKGVVAS